ncbi:unnamed protein product, partial [Hapterophycus canaliculatus]
GLNISRHAKSGLASLNSSRHAGAGVAASPAHGVDNRPAIVRAASSLNESRHKLTQGLRRTVSRGQISVNSDYDGSQQPRSPEAFGHTMLLDEGSNVLLLKGTLRTRLGSTAFPSLREERAVTIIRDVGGPVEFSEGSVLFIMPAMLMARASAGHQMLMREIEQRYREI